MRRRESLALLYRGQQTFATGHGCAAGLADGSRTNQSWLGSYGDCHSRWWRFPGISPDLYRDKEMKDRILVAMQPLAGLVPGDDGFGGGAGDCGPVWGMDQTEEGRAGRAGWASGNR